ncbi:MAG: diguanylate cyclase [Candidatus Accumulibacter sp.]|nr:diguanylate cyclase [Accumulibacter sp.]
MWRPLLKDTLRESDFVARYGGEEFLAVPPETNAEGALRLAETVRQTVSRHAFPAGRAGDGKHRRRHGDGPDKHEEVAVPRGRHRTLSSQGDGRNAVRGC